MKRAFVLFVLLLVAATAALVAVRGGFLDPAFDRAREQADRALPDVGPFRPTPTQPGADRTGLVPAAWAGAVPVAAEPATVTRIADGDSIEVRYDDGREEDVRILLIDAPETWYPPECFGKEGAAYLASVMPAGSRVLLEADVQDRDRYGRQLRHVWMERDGVPYLVNESIVRSGHAVRLIIPPNVRYADELGAAQAAARSEGAGLWGPCREWGEEKAE